MWIELYIYHNSLEDPPSVAVMVQLGSFSPRIYQDETGRVMKRCGACCHLLYAISSNKVQDIYELYRKFNCTGSFQIRETYTLKRDTASSYVLEHGYQFFG